MKILFIIPPDTMRIESSVSEKLDRGREFRAPLGLLSVAGAVRDTEGVERVLVDCPASGLDYEGLGRKIKEAAPDLVAVSALTFTLLDALKSARLAKEVVPGVKTIIGGFHVALYPDETLAFDEIDFIVHGEGEVPFQELVEAMKDGESGRYAHVPGLGYKDAEGRPVLNEKPAVVKDMDLLPSPAYELLDFEKYTHVLAGDGRSISVQTSRGCPYKCLFCDIRGTKLRFKSPEAVIGELRGLKERGVSDIFFIDDTISVNKDRLKEICRLIIDEGLHISYRISARVDNVDEEMLHLLKRSGCTRVSYGVESGSQRLLDYLEKGITLDQIREAFRATRRAGLQSFAFLMIGIPTETAEEMEASMDFVESIKADYMNISLCTPYPKTALYAQMLDDGIVDGDYWQEFAQAPTEEFRVRFFNRDFEVEELRRIQDRLMKRFYRRPSYILSELGKVRSGKELLKKAKVALRILKP